MSLFQKTVRRQVLELPTGEIRPNPHQPRRTFSREDLDELALSISQVGILQPLSVRRTPEGWELIAGERRLRAAELAGLARVPCLPVEADGSDSALLALVENLQRQDLDFWEEALALERLISRWGLSQQEAARQIGKSQSAVANKLRLLRLPEAALTALRDAGCTERHARALLRLDSPEAQCAAARAVAERGLTVSQTEQYVEGLLSPKPRKCRLIYCVKDVRLFLNTVNRGLSIMNAAGVAASCGREETDSEILLTIRIPKGKGPALASDR